MDKKKIAISIAKSKGYSTAEFQITWNGFDVYSAIIKSEDTEPPAIGLPIFILVNDTGQAHIASEKEWSAFVDQLSE